MNFTRYENVTVGERTRELIPEHLEELVLDIRKNGLLQPIVLGDRGDSPLIDGLHRLHALHRLHGEAEIIAFDGAFLAPGEIPFIRFSDLDPARLLEVEIAANLYRRELTWQEKNRALARLHAMEQELNPNATLSSTAQKLVGTTGKSVDATRQSLQRAIVIADALEQNPELASARSETEAYSRIKTDFTRLATSLLGDGFAATNSQHILHEGSLIEVLPTLETESVDLILTDPPYGVGADGWTSKFKDAPHHYRDTMKHAMMLYSHIYGQGFRIGKERSNIFTFCAVEYWSTLRDMAESCGWSVWPRPVIWHKSNEGIRPWGQKGYAYCYEAILFACKGQRGLSRTGSDVISGIYKVRDREHGAAKPAALYANLIQSACLPGDVVLDPCAGSGTIFEAATLASAIAIGIELDPHYAELARSRMTTSPETLAAEELDTF